MVIKIQESAEIWSDLQDWNGHHQGYRSTLAPVCLDMVFPWHHCQSDVIHDVIGNLMSCGIIHDIMWCHLWHYGLCTIQQQSWSDQKNHLSWVAMTTGRLPRKPIAQGAFWTKTRPSCQVWCQSAHKQQRRSRTNIRTANSNCSMITVTDTQTGFSSQSVWFWGLFRPIQEILFWPTQADWGQSSKGSRPILGLSRWSEAYLRPDGHIQESTL